MKPRYLVTLDSTNEGKFLVMKRIKGNWRTMKGNLTQEEANIYAQSYVEDDDWHNANRD